MRAFSSSIQLITTVRSGVLDSVCCLRNRKRLPWRETSQLRECAAATYRPTLKEGHARAESELHARLDGNRREHPGSVDVEELAATVTRPRRVDAASGRNGVSRPSHVGKRANVDLELTAFVRLVG